MISNYFTIEGKRKVLVRKENEHYISFDPINLDFYRINETAAEILYLVSVKKDLSEIIDYFINEYGLGRSYTKEMIKDFFENFPLKNLIFTNLITLKFGEIL
ncbi:hypothetical protein [Wukongibacter sp. M2B1]|uniref:hypothetical protein n=1 Tax=Wukongibacter sp. M2B1 TaxID=3088895 RepID=UPI003D7C119A